MGSLMAGWDSPVPDPKSVTYQRNRSFTKGEIESYWRTKKITEEEHLRAISSSSDISQVSSPSQTNKFGSSYSFGMEKISEGSERRFLQSSSSLPLANTKENFMDMETHETSLEKLIKKNGWWTRSNWAFLNEPPVIASEGPSNTYAPQFHVAHGLQNQS